MINELIYKYLDNEASETEVATIFEWIEKSEDNKNHFFKIKKAWAFTSKDESSKHSIWKDIKNEKSKRKQKSYFKLWRYAAAFIILFGLGKLISTTKSSKSSKIDRVVLESSNGNINYLDQEQEKNLLDTKGDVVAEQYKTEIIYKANSQKEITEFHTLKIPFGKTFKVTLSDGSIVHLNSGTTFKYPEHFGNENNREVFLTGEAFFEVAKDKEHPFIVHYNNIAVEVLGTKFNISAYPEDEQMSTVLVEGLVSISEQSNNTNSTLLAPNYKASWNKTKKAFDIKNVDVNIYTSWIQGEFIFKDVPFNVIAKKLERSYNVKIINNNNFLGSQKFSGTIKIKDSGIDKILDLLKLDTPFEYSINRNTIEIHESNL